MFSRLATVLQELSGEEPPDGHAQDMLVPQLPPGEGQTPGSPGASDEEPLERLAHLEQLVVQLKELIRSKDSELANKDLQLKNEKETAEARFTKLKLQAKAKMTSLNKQIADLKGQEGASQSPDSSFTGGAAAASEEELQELRAKLKEEEANGRTLQDTLHSSQLLLQEKEAAHAEQLRVLQAVICEKDVRFQEQIQKHEEELLNATSQNDTQLQQALHAVQRRCEELEEAVHSRSQVVDMLQQELNSADQQKQILTAHFRQMEQDLAEASRQREAERQQWVQTVGQAEAELEALRGNQGVAEQQRAELARLEAELASLREAEHRTLAAAREALEKEKSEVARLEEELASVRGAEAVAVQQVHNASESYRTQIAGLQEELLSLREARDEQEASEDRRTDVERLERELESLREEQEESRERTQTLERVWRGLRSLALGEAGEEEEQSAAPTDASAFMDTLNSLEVQLRGLRQEQKQREEEKEREEKEREELTAAFTRNMEALQEQLQTRLRDAEEEASVRIRQLEQQIEVMSNEASVQRMPETSEHDSSEAEKAHILALELQLSEREAELTALRERLTLAEEEKTRATSREGGEMSPRQGHDNTKVSDGSPTTFPNLLDDTLEQDTTLVPEDTSALSVSADNDSSPELIGTQSESPGESKGASSDEMVTSSDSEVAHSSWTLLEAVNQEGVQEWPSVLQDFGPMQLQSWEATSIEQESSTVQAESSTVVIRETVQVTHHGASLSDADATPGQVFTQALADELQKRYSELLAELQALRETSTESQEKIQNLEEEIQSLSAAKENTESKAQSYAEELCSVREQLNTLSQQSCSVMEKYTDDMQRLEEQIAVLQAEGQNNALKTEALMSDLEEAQLSLSEREGQVRMLSAQLEERELLSSDLERKLHDMENSLLENSETANLSIVSLSEKDSEISELHLRLTQKEQEMTELNDSMSAKLLQAGEEKFLISSEVKKLKDHILELEKVKEPQKMKDDESAADVEDELRTLRKNKEEQASQLVNMRKKLQAALVQRKELMKKVSDFEEEAKKLKKQTGTAAVEDPSNISDKDNVREQEFQKMEAILEELRLVLKSKEEAVEILEQRISQQDQVLAETLAINEKLNQEVQQADASSEMAQLQSQVTSLGVECAALQKKLLEAQEARKDTIRKAKDKDRHHREQLKQQKEEYNELLERFQTKGGEQEALLMRVKYLEVLLAQKEVSTEKEVTAHEDTKAALGTAEKPGAGDWVQEDWVDFAAPETESAQQSPQQSPQPEEQSKSDSVEEEVQTLRVEVQAERSGRAKLEEQLQEAQANLSLRETELLNLEKELEVLREREKQIDALSMEMETVREKCLQAESYAQTLKAEMEAAAASAHSETSIVTLQAEVDEFKEFLNNKNMEIVEMSEQLREQNSLLLSMQERVSEKDQLIVSLQEGLKAEQEKSQKLEAEIPLKQEEENNSEAKIQQLQRKLQAALISRKDALKDNKLQKEELASTQKVVAELRLNMEAKESELEKLRGEREKLIEEVDRSLLENQSLGSSCESLKLAMDGIITEKNACKREAEFAKEEITRMGREWEEKVQGMKDEYETLLKSYENVSDEAERVRRVLEAARQERQELAARIRTHEASRQEAERQAEVAQKEVESIKDKMRKYAKTKQQKIMDLEEENERLREMEERKGFKREEKAMKVETERQQQELQTLKDEMDAMKAENIALQQQAAELKEQLAQEVEKGDRQIPSTSQSSDDVIEESVVPQQSEIVMAENAKDEPEESKTEGKEEPEVNAEAPAEVITAESAPETQAKPPDETVEEETTESSQAKLEDKIREMEATLSTEKELSQQREAHLNAELASAQHHLLESQEKADSLVASLQQSLEETKGREQNLVEEASKREAQFKELRSSLEADKDDLEERLMNQLAQLNGSIARYQQEAADSRTLLADLQREVERLERERAELEAQAKSEMDRAARLEEDKRQAQRERAEAEAESGKQRELEQQLKSAQRVKEGSQSRARQLEELLREKQLEVRQMQKDCIQYQERISELGREAKALQLAHDEIQKELEQSRLETSKALEEMKRTAGELVNTKSNLDEAQKAASQAQAEKAACEQAAQQKEAAMKAEAEETLDSVRFRLGAELKQMELSLDEAYRERDREEEATLEAREMAEAAERQAQEMQARLDESLARLAAFSRCMSSLQDDRDRVLDEARQWETRFNSALQGKEAEVREAETKAKELTEQLQKETALKDELQLSVDKLQKADKEWCLRLEDGEKKMKDSQAALEEERGKLQQTTAQMQTTLTELQALQGEAEGLRHRAAALEEAVGRLQGEADLHRAELREREAEERRLCLSVEQLETDLRSSKTLTESLQTDLSEKERREVELLGEKEHAVAQAAEEARKEADSRAQEAEKELDDRREEVRGLEDRLRSAEEESSQTKSRLDSFTKAMGSLQDDRDRVLNMYRQLEERHLQVMMEKDGLIQEAAGENNSLKEELRSLLVQRDDLHAEKAKLASQLHNYRDELTQVLSMKESQHRQLLAGQRQRIASLEAQLRTAARDAELETVTLSQAGDEPKDSQVKDAPGAEVEKLREQLQVARDKMDTLEETLEEERREQAAKVKELAELRWEGGVMRTESESAQERVAELARDLMVVEQRLLGEKEIAEQLSTENQALKKAMASLQDSRDQALNRAQEVSLRLEEMSKAAGPPPTSSPSGSTGEVWSLKNALQALQNDRERLLEQVQQQSAELQSQRGQLSRLGAGELIKVSQELLEERRRTEETTTVLKQLEDMVELGKQEIETLRLERVDWMAQAEQLKQQTLATLSERDHQLRQLSAMLEEAHASKPKVQEEQYQRASTEALDSAPGAPQERSSTAEGHAPMADIKELQRRLEEEMEQRLAVEEQLMVAQDRLKRETQGEWRSDDQFSETAILIEAPEGALSRTRRGGPGLMRMLRAAFCSRQRTPLLVSLYLLTVHALLLLCLGGYL